jgi:hypothetical protein
VCNVNNRLIVIGPKRDVKRFQECAWEMRFRGKFIEPLEFSPGRFACQFQTDSAALNPLRGVSGCWPQLVFLLDFEHEANRIKGLAKAIAGELEHWQISY